MIVVIGSLLPVFLLIVLGFCLKHFHVVPEEMWRGVEQLGYWVFFPSLLASTMARADLQSIEISAISLTMIAAFATMAIGLLAGRKRLAASLDIANPAFTSVFQCSTRWNGFVALPIAVELYGNTGTALVAIVMACLVPLANALNVIVLAKFASDQVPSWRRTLYIVFRNPFIWATIIGLAINLLHIPIYKPLMTALDLLGGAALGTGLLMVGAGLLLRYALPPRLPAVFGTVTKLLIMPALVSGYAFLFGLSGVSFAVAIICASVPTAMNGYLLAKQMGGDAPLQAATTTLQTVISFITIPVLVWAAG